tara:strand:- start:406 stop:546 length:141 start_codon:yes stop_codon:yes gene_type:complete
MDQKDKNTNINTLNENMLKILKELEKMNKFLYNIENKPLRVKTGPK